MRLALDVDDTCANFMGPATAVLGPSLLTGAHSLRDMYPDQPDQVQTLLSDGSFYAGLPAMDGAARAIGELTGLGFRVFYISARPSALDWITRDWLFWNGFPQGAVHCVGRAGGRKAGLIKLLDIDIAVDDYPAALDEIRLLSSAKAVVMDRDWNQDYHDIPRLMHWDDALDLFQGLINEAMN